VVKAMLLVCYLDQHGVRGRALRHRDYALLRPMIRWSDDRAARRVFRMVGARGLSRLAHHVGMHRFHPHHIWGRSRIDAADQTRFFLHIDRFVVPRHRIEALQLLASVVPRQRWGIARVVPSGWTLYFKSGWGLGTGWVDHQSALLLRAESRVAVTILTHSDPNHSYGKATLKGIAARLLRGLSLGSQVQ
jgi:hypothetical protein